MSKREGFTLIEVMVSVMIISVVVTALLQLQSATTKNFTHLRKIQKSLQYASLLQGSRYGYENDSLTLDRLLDAFDLDDDLRRELKNIRARVLYQRLETIDTSDLQGDEMETQEQQNEVSLVIEIGRTVLQLPDGSASILRIRIP